MKQALLSLMIVINIWAATEPTIDTALIIEEVELTTGLIKPEFFGYRNNKKPNIKNDMKSVKGSYNYSAKPVLIKKTKTTEGTEKNRASQKRKAEGTDKEMY